MGVIRVRLFLALLLVLAVGGPIRGALADDVEGLTRQARSAIVDLADGLRSELVAAISAGGPLEAIAACNISAPAIAESSSQNHGLEVGRTALRLRNPANAPDDFERGVMERFLSDVAAGKAIEGLEHAEIVEEGGKRIFRFMKAIGMAAKPCLACHGSDIAPPVRARISELYPQDRAVEFNVGELRGAFTVTRILD